MKIVTGRCSNVFWYGKFEDLTLNIFIKKQMCSGMKKFEGLTLIFLSKNMCSDMEV
jgi:hypothetical protein